MIRPVLPSAHPFGAYLKAGRVAADGASLGTELQSWIAGMRKECRYVFGTGVEGRWSPSLCSFLVAAFALPK